MKFSTPLLTTFFLAATTLSAPVVPRKIGSTLNHRTAVRAAHNSRPLQISTTTTNAASNSTTDSIVSSNNWAGPVLTNPPTGEIFNAVSGSVTVPSVSAGTGNGPWSVSAWVGIDGATYQKAILQTGVDFNIDANGGQSFSAWYEWYPDYSYSFSDFSMSVGDVIAMQVVSTNATAGTAILENVSTGQTVTKDLTAPSNSSALGGQNAEWIVEDYSQGGLVPLADWHNVTFCNCMAGTDAGQVLGLDNATVWDIEKNSKLVTKVDIQDVETVQITYL